MRLQSASAFFLFVLTSCGVGYQSRGFRGGYVEKQVNPQTFEVTFFGNAFTSAATARHFAVQRADEICHHRYKVEQIENLKSVDSLAGEDDCFSDLNGKEICGLDQEVSKPKTVLRVSCGGELRLQ